MPNWLFYITWSERLHGQTIKTLKYFVNVMFSKWFATRRFVINKYKTNAVVLFQSMRWSEKPISMVMDKSTTKVSLQIIIFWIPVFGWSSCSFRWYLKCSSINCLWKIFLLASVILYCVFGAKESTLKGMWPTNSYTVIKISVIISLTMVWTHSRPAVIRLYWVFQ